MLDRVPGIDLSGVATEKIVDTGDGYVVKEDFVRDNHNIRNGDDVVFDMKIAAVTEEAAIRKANLYARANYPGLGDDIEAVASAKTGRGRVRNVYNVAVGIRGR